jgi:hypothetical protein
VDLSNAAKIKEGEGKIIVDYSFEFEIFIELLADLPFSYLELHESIRSATRRTYIIRPSLLAALYSICKKELREGKNVWYYFKS